VKWRWIAGGLLALLLASVALNIRLSRQVANIDRILNTVRLDPINLGTYPADALPPDPMQRRVVVFGDSRAQDWPAPEGLESFTFINRGILTQTSAQVRLRFAAHVQPLRPDVLLIQMCTNDLLTIPVFPERREAILTGCQQNVAAILDEARAQGTVVILTTVFPMSSDDLTQAVTRINDEFRSLAADDVILFDAYALLVDSRGLLRADLRVDELHLNAAGYALLNQSLIPLLQTLGESRDPDQHLQP
jgi:lysophospholipase L1-like esterase